MSNIDRKYIDALDIFTSALEEIVETLKSQKKTADPVNQFLKTPMGDLNQVVTELKAITVKTFSTSLIDFKLGIILLNGIFFSREFMLLK